jgi:hypothetical protein
VLVLATQAAAATSEAQTTTTSPPRAGKAANDRSAHPGVVLDRKRAAARRLRGTIRFFESRRTLQGASGAPAVAATALRRAKRRLARVRKEIAYYERRVARWKEQREARRLAHAPPTVVIRTVFGRYARQALAIAWCESRWDVDARNGQYLGLFQMGSYERSLFGHGRTAHAQALAAHRYFVLSGRDWSPWGCRWAAS